MRVIDADKFILALMDASLSSVDEDTILDLIDSVPTVDAVVVTRCKDCKHKGWVQEPCHGKSVDYCRVWDCTLQNLESTFCSYGERKDGES
jgi:hypothetical protein